MACLRKKPVPAALEVIAGDHKGKIFTLGGERPVILGRGLESDFTLYDSALEYRHCKIEPAGNGFRIADLETLNGTFLNGKRITEAHLKDGDLIRFGKITIRFREYVEQEPTVPAENLRCRSCGTPIESLGDFTRLSGEPYCHRCVDRRLHVSRGLASYRILRKIGRTPMEIIYLAEQEEDAKKVTLRILKAEKLSNPRVLSRFLTKALYGLTLKHPNLLNIIDVGNNQGSYYMVQEYVEWRSLEDRFEKGETFPLKSSLYILLQLCHVLSYGRKKNLVFGRLREDRIVLDERNRPKITNFWLPPYIEGKLFAALEVQSPSPADPGDPEAPRIIIVTPSLLQYVSPQATGQMLRRTQRGHVFTLGILFHRLLTGANPPAQGTVRRFYRRLLKRYRRDRGEQAVLTPVFHKLIGRMLDRNPSNRYQTIVDLHQDLKTAYLSL
jgi:serine/threonine protein kinase